MNIIDVRDILDRKEREAQWDVLTTPGIVYKGSVSIYSEEDNFVTLNKGRGQLVHIAVQHIVALL